jgi:hypothetical protein
MSPSLWLISTSCDLDGERPLIDLRWLLPHCFWVGLLESRISHIAQAICLGEMLIPMIFHVSFQFQLLPTALIFPSQPCDWRWHVRTRFFHGSSF